MSVETSSTPTPPKKKPRNRNSQLKVVFDTNALYVPPNSLGSASDLVRQDIISLISESKYPDLDISWCLPEVVRHERQYQMQTEALKLRGAIDKVEKLLRHNLALTDRALVDGVKVKIDEKKNELGLQELQLDHNLVDWPAMIQAAVYRIAPFEAGEKEKGFRDALVAETFLQLVNSSPKTPAVCRVVLVTADVLLSQAVNARIKDSPNAHVLSNIEELKGLINTVVSNVGEEFISQLKPKADKLFFTTAEEKDTLYYKKAIKDQLKSKFESQLQALPSTTTFRRNLVWRISPPNFSRKDARRVFWTSRIEAEFEAGYIINDESKSSIGSMLNNALWQYTVPPLQPYNVANAAPQLVLPSTLSVSEQVPLSTLGGPVTVPDWAKYSLAEPKRVITHKGNDVFEILWSTDVTLAMKLTKARIEDIKYIGLNFQPV